MLQNRRRGPKSWIPEIQALILVFLFFQAQAPTFADRVVSCHDADTCRIEVNGKITKVRFYGIDAPEINQPFGEEAANYLNHLIIGKSVTLRCKGTSYDRQACDVFLNGQDVSALLVQNGYAWDYPEFSKGRYSALQNQAQKAHLGLWGQQSITSPYCWRWTGVKACKNPQYQP